jgi:hypothetical protein
MQGAPFQWPNGFLLTTIACAIGAAVVAWMLLCMRRGGAIALGAAIVASFVWFAYESYLSAVAIPGDPLIRIDLCAIFPPLVAAWICTAVLWIRTRSMKGTVD